MKRTNLSIFIPHSGCLHRCSFCNQNTISGSSSAPTAEEVSALLSKQQKVLESSETAAEIAFFGGSFTAIDREYMEKLLKVASEYVERYPGQYIGIRCSTRPDAIDDEILGILKKYGMTAIELGAQSMSDEVLQANHRGHTAEQVRTASEKIKEYGFSLGLQMMTGLYKDTPEACLNTADEFIALGCDTVRIYPTVVLKGTLLGTLYDRGVFRSFGFDETIDLCAVLLEKFSEAGIPVIRLGLHASPDVENAMLDGVYHPALREIVESRVFFNEIKAEMIKQGKGHYIIYTDKRNTSRIIGQKKLNRVRLGELGFTFDIKNESGTRLRIVSAG